MTETITLDLKSAIRTTKRYLVIGFPLHRLTPIALDILDADVNQSLHSQLEEFGRQHGFDMGHGVTAVEVAAYVGVARA